MGGYKEDLNTEMHLVILATSPVNVAEKKLSERVLKANLSYTRHFFRQISFVEEFEGEFFICSYDVSR